MQTYSCKAPMYFESRSWQEKLGIGSNYYTHYPLLFTLSTLYCIAEMWSSMRKVVSVVETSMVAFSPKRRAIR